MVSVPLIGLWLLGLFIAYKLVAFIIVRFQHAAASKRWGCKPPPTFPSPDPLGAVNVYQLIDANNQGRLTEYIKGRTDLLTKMEGREVLTMQTHIFRNWLIYTHDPKNVQAILATQFKDFELGPIRSGTFSPLLGHGIFSADGKQWEHSRSLLRPQFARDQVSDLELEETHLQNLLLAMPVNPDGWTDATDIMPLNFRLTIDSATEFLFGESVDTQRAALPGFADSARSRENQGFVNSFESSQEVIAKAFRFNDFYWVGLTKEYYEQCKICHQYIDQFIQKAMTREKTGSEKRKYVFLDALAEVTKDPVEIRDQVLSILVAGRDTTASLMSFAWLMLAQHPEVFKKLRQTILNEFGTGTENITFSSLKACAYLQWVMNETLRLFPTVPINSRRSIVDTSIPRGGGPDGLSPIFVPKGTEVNYSVYAMHRNKHLWGAKAEEFIPERWEGYKPGFEYLPFNGGPRICLGQQFALTEAGYVLVRMLQRFDKIDATPMNNVPTEWFLHLTGRPKHGVRLRFHLAE